MGSGAYGGTYAAPVWHDYMLAAQGKDCPDFPAPENPVDFSSWSGSHAVSARSTTPGYGGTNRPGPPSAVRPSAPTNRTPPSGGADGQYPPDLYAPGAGQGAAEVVLDRTPIGDYFEIEGAVETIRTVAAELGMNMDQAIRQTYADLYRTFTRDGAG